MYKHYIRLDSTNRIVKGYSDAFEQPQEGDICINEDGSYQFRLEPDSQENPPLTDYDGIPQYKYADGAVVARGIVEIEADRVALPVVEQPVPIDQRIVAVEDAITSLMFGEGV